jgi:tetratricopeptide (TPR) repeat protein
VFFFATASPLSAQQAGAKLPPAAVKPAPSAEDIAKLIDAVRTANAAERPALLKQLVDAGPAALDATRKARDEAPTADEKAVFARAATWQLAALIEKRLHEGVESQLTFDGQYTSLREHGREGIDALFAIIDDDTTRVAYRLAACRALADAGDASLVPRLRALHNDALLLPALREELGIVMAVFGEKQAVEDELRRSLRFASSPFLPLRLEAHLALANLNYRVRDYKKAVEAYEEIISVTQQIQALQKRSGAPEDVIEETQRNLGLHYYNAACSNSLHGDFERAQKYLRKAVEAEPMHFQNMERDGDLLKLRQQPGYEAFRKELGKLFEGKSL